jgi:DNA-damage-inducible protein J
MASTAMIHVRIDDELKTAAAETLASMGLSLSDAIRVFLTRVVADNEMPFAIKAPNAASRVAIAETEGMIQRRRARFATADELFDGLEKKQQQVSVHSRQRFHEVILERLGASFSFRTLRYEAAQGGHGFAGREQWAARSRVA